MSIQLIILVLCVVDVLRITLYSDNTVFEFVLLGYIRQQQQKETRESYWKVIRRNKCRQSFFQRVKQIHLKMIFKMKDRYLAKETKTIKINLSFNT